MPNNVLRGAARLLLLWVVAMLLMVAALNVIGGCSLHYHAKPLGTATQPAEPTVRDLVTEGLR